ELSRRAREMCLGGEQPEQVIRVRSAEDNRFILFHMRRCYVPEAGPHVLAATSETAWPDGFDDLLKGSFGLTSAEVDVVRQIVECQSVKDIAEARGRSVDTVRVQVKSILSKTEAHSQSELVRLALSLMDMATVDQTAMPERPATRTLSLEPRPFQTLWTATGRRLDYVTFGDPAGRPLLYLHGAYGLCRWSPAAEQRAAQKGLRVIVPIRAGYGATDLVPRDADYAHMQTADLIQVMDAEGVTRAPVVTMGSDIYFAVWLAHFHPTRVSHILGGGPSLPLTRPEQFERMEKWHRFVNAGARYTPKVLPFIVKAGFLLARRLGKRGFIHAVHGDVPGDVAVFENPDIFPAFEFGTDIALSATHAAHDAFSQQAIAHQTSDWRSALEGLESKVPVIALFGDDDPEMPPETLAELQSDYPWLDWRIKPNVGQLVLFRYLFDIIDEFAPA
ncbi:MAG: LuxR C-terminal-related transcriptional regulator, partial [Pseudomonadota bacterium]